MLLVGSRKRGQGNYERNGIKADFVGKRGIVVPGEVWFYRGLSVVGGRQRQNLREAVAVRTGFYASHEGRCPMTKFIPSDLSGAT